jgi:hypothetical protein
MKVFLAVAVMLFAMAAVADNTNFTYSFTGSQGETAVGSLSGHLTAPGQYLITSGTITIAGDGALNGTGVLVSPVPLNFYTGGGTILTGLDNLLFPDSNPQLTTTGGLGFMMNSSLAWIIHEVSSQKSKDALKG